MEVVYITDEARDTSVDRRTYGFQTIKRERGRILNVEMDDIYNYSSGFIRISADDGVNTVIEDISLDFASISNLNSKLSSVMLNRIKFYERQGYLLLLMKTDVTVNLKCYGNYNSLIGDTSTPTREIQTETIEDYQKYFRFDFRHYLDSNYLNYTEIKFPIIDGLPKMILTSRSKFINSNKSIVGKILDNNELTVKHPNLPTIYITVSYY